MIFLININNQSISENVQDKKKRSWLTPFLWVLRMFYSCAICESIRFTQSVKA